MTRFGFLLILFLATTLGRSFDNEIFSIEDPSGDDSGSGTIAYPTGDDFEQGDLDLISFSASATEKGTWFEVRFANPLRPPGERTSRVSAEPLKNLVDFDFYNLNIDLYIDTDNKPGSGFTTTLPGRKIDVSTETAWERAVIVTPRPTVARSVYRSWLIRDQKEYMKANRIPLKGSSNQVSDDVDQLLEGSYYFPRRVIVNRRNLRFFVPDEFLGGPARSDWHYLVLVTGSNPEQRMDFKLWHQESHGLMMLPLGGGRPFESFSVSGDGDLEQPPIIDVLLPTVQAQKDMLLAYDSINSIHAVLSGISPARPETVPAALRAPAVVDANPVPETDPVVAARPAAIIKPIDPSAPESKGEHVIRIKKEMVLKTGDQTADVVITQEDLPAEVKEALEKLPEDQKVFIIKQAETEEGSKPMVWVQKEPKEVTSEEQAPQIVEEKVVKKARSVVDRLKELEELRKQKLVTEEEYQKLRTEILKDL